MELKITADEFNFVANSLIGSPQNTTPTLRNNLFGVSFDHKRLIPEIKDKAYEENAIKYIKLDPLMQSIKPGRNGLSPLMRHPFLCGICKKFKLPQRLFQRNSGMPIRKKFCNCVNSKKNLKNSLGDEKRILNIIPASNPVHSRDRKSDSGYPSANLPNEYKEQHLVATGIGITKSSSKNKDVATPTEITKIFMLSDGIIRGRELFGKIKSSEHNLVDFETEGINLETKEEINVEETGKYKYLIHKGNNSKLIRHVMGLREKWEEGDYNLPNSSHFLWHPTSAHVKFGRLLSYLPTQITNHFEFHSELTNKVNLFKNLRNYCLQRSIDINEIMPITFEIDIESKVYHSQMMLFVSYYKNLQKEEKKPLTKQKLFSFDSVVQQKLPPSTHFVGENIWILKPSGFNRGRGIHVFSDLETLKTLFSEFQEIGLAKKIRKSKHPPKENGKISSLKFVIQKYIESPLLINNRKFDIRVWVLVTHELNCYFFPQGYLRTSSEAFTLNRETLSSEYVHLTNNAIQKEGKEYGKFEDGNQLSFAFFEKFINGLNQDVKFNNLMNSIKDNITHSILSARGKINRNMRQHCFEIFGYDFIVDSSLQVWLIECNTNPCLELSSPLLQQLIPRMINEAFELSVDLLFPIENKNKIVDFAKVVELPEGNLWEFLVSLKKSRKSAGSYGAPLRTTT